MSNEQKAFNKISVAKELFGFLFGKDIAVRIMEKQYGGSWKVKYKIRSSLVLPIMKIYFWWRIYLLCAKIPKRNGWEKNYGNAFLRFYYKKYGN